MTRLMSRLAAGAATCLMVLALAGCNQQPSSNALLSSLVPSTGATLFPSFDPGITEYTARITNVASGISLTPTAQDAGADITVSGVPVISGTSSTTASLGTGTTILTIIVTAQDSVTTSTYTVTADIVFDGFDGVNTAGLDLGNGWTIYGTAGTDMMYAFSGWVRSEYWDAANDMGVAAECKDSMDYTKGLYASALVNLASTAPLGGDPNIVCGIMLNTSWPSWTGYFCEIEWNSATSAYRLCLGEFGGASVTQSSSADISPAFEKNTTYLLEIDSKGAAFTANLKSYDGVTTYCTVALSDNPRTYTTGKVAFYNYVTDAADNPTGYVLYWDELTIEQY
jgi:hypothetical protein